MRVLQPRSFILLPLAIVFIATGDTIQLRNWKFRRAFRHELHSFRIAELAVPQFYFIASGNCICTFQPLRIPLAAA